MLINMQIAWLYVFARSNKFDDDALDTHAEELLQLLREVAEKDDLKVGHWRCEIT